MYFKFYFLVEDQSGAALIEKIMQKLMLENPGLEYDCKPFRGIGGFINKGNARATKAGKLLNDLPIYLRGYNKSLQYTPAAVVVVMDNDTRNTEDFYRQLHSIANENNIEVDYVFCVAVEEMEAWLLGDEEALTAAYPSAKLKPLHDYKQDSICGTWEVLAEVVYRGGLKQFKEDCPAYPEIGMYKREWAEKIGEHMNLSKNKSPSFQYFYAEIIKRISENLPLSNNAQP